MFISDLILQLENAGLQRLCDAKDKLLEAREAEKQQLKEMLEQRLSDLGISPEQLYDSGTAEKQEVVGIYKSIQRFDDAWSESKCMA